jgi:hypothetical protein
MPPQEIPTTTASSFVTDSRKKGNSDSSVDSESSDSVVGSPSPSDDETSDDEFDNPKMRPKDRAELEKVISGGKTYTTVQYKKDWEAAKAKEDKSAKRNRCDKYGWDMAAGATNQLTSFAIAGAAATFSGNPWVFPVVAMLTSDLIGDRLAQVIRRSTIVASGSKAHFENQRRAARALGDLIESCAGRQPNKKFTVSVTDSHTGETSNVKMTAAEALRHTGHCTNLSSWAQNLLVRGLPFIWFSAIYGPRDYYLNYRCGDAFFPNATAMHEPNFTTPTGCPDPAVVDEVALRWSVILFGGMMAGALTLVTNQLTAACMPHEERTNYSPETFKKEVIYKESAKLDAKTYLDWLAQRDSEDGEHDDEVKMTHTLSRIYDKELQVARKKSSLWTTFQGELDQATQKHRDETMITPEFGGKRLEMFMSMLGKFLTLLTYAYFVSRFNVRASTEEQDKMMGLIMIPLSLIFIGGYALRDDARIVGQVPYGLFKGAGRACKRFASEAENGGRHDNDNAATTTAIPEVVTSGELESDQTLTPKHSSPRSQRESEKVRSTSETPARSPRHNQQGSSSSESSSDEEDGSIIV